MFTNEPKKTKCVPSVYSRCCETNFVNIIIEHFTELHQIVS